MVIRRTTFFLLLALVYIAMVVVPKLVWLSGSKKTMGTFAFQGGGNALDQFPDRSSFIYFIYSNDTVWFKAPGRLDLPRNSPVRVRFRENDPKAAKIDNFRNIWLPTLVYGSLPLLVLLVTFVHPAIVPYRSRIVLIPRKPFIKVISWITCIGVLCIFASIDSTNDIFNRIT
jgi:hypothetical protein